MQFRNLWDTLFWVSLHMDYFHLDVSIILRHMSLTEKGSINLGPFRSPHVSVRQLLKTHGVSVILTESLCLCSWQDTCGI